jgi:hypothetical protein
LVVEDTGRVEFDDRANHFKPILQRGNVIEKVNGYVETLQGLPGIPAPGAGDLDSKEGEGRGFFEAAVRLLADENRWEPRRVLGELQGDSGSGSGSGPGNIGGLRGSSTTMTATTRVSIASSASGAGTPDTDNCEGIEWG